MRFSSLILASRSTIKNIEDTVIAPTDPNSAKGRLLLIAATLFNQKGYERTTVRDLANAAGIQSGSLFHHFKTKEDILKSVMVDTIIFNTERMKKEMAKAENCVAALKALIRCELESINGETGEAMSVLVYEWRSLNADNQAMILKLRDEYESLWIDTISAAKRNGLVSGDVFVLRRLLTGALSWTKTWYKPKGEMTLDELAEQALNLAIKHQA
jgi:AcrR family transcriptional regulator